MAHTLVKILSDDYGEPRERNLQKCHYVKLLCGGTATLCEGEYYGYGESGVQYKEKHTDKGGITCPKCLDFIKEIESIKL